MPERVDQRFRFVQFEFPGVLGPEAGRYVVREAREGRPRHILVLSVLGAPQRRRLSRARPRSAEPQPLPHPVPTSRITVIDTRPVAPAEAERWLSGLGGEAAREVADDALTVVNRAVSGHRVAAAEPALRDVEREQALVTRVGHGAGEQVANGRWSGAVEVPSGLRRPRRLALLRPQERLAALLGGRERPLACEELTLRARQDADAGRWREAALQMRVALEAAIAELAVVRGPQDMAQRVAGLGERRPAVGSAANEALDGPLSAATIRDVEQALERLEAALRARASVGPATTR